MAYLLIDPDERLDYAFDWADFIEDTGSPTDTIIGSLWSIVPSAAGSPTAPLLENQGFFDSRTIVFVSGASLGAVYQLSNQISTAQGRIAERSITLRCETR